MAFQIPEEFGNILGNATHIKHLNGMLTYHRSEMALFILFMLVVDNAALILCLMILILTVLGSPLCCSTRNLQCILPSSSKYTWTETMGYVCVALLLVAIPRTWPCEID